MVAPYFAITVPIFISTPNPNDTWGFGPDSDTCTSGVFRCYDERTQTKWCALVHGPCMVLAWSMQCCKRLHDPCMRWSLHHPCNVAEPFGLHGRSLHGSCNVAQPLHGFAVSELVGLMDWHELTGCCGTWFGMQVGLRVGSNFYS